MPMPVLQQLAVAMLVTVLALAQVGPASGSFGTNVSCVVRPHASQVDVGHALDWVCSNPVETKVDCTPINPGGPHYYPNTLVDHANWAFTQYYALHAQLHNLATCDFGGVAMLQCPENTDAGIVKERIRGVNLGGFLVLEPFITPSLFEQFVGKPLDQTAIDEYTFSAVLGAAEASRQLQAHWNKWVTEDDIARIAALGLTHIRVPFGYWIFGDVPPFVRGIEQLDRVVALAGKHGLKVLLDLHGAVGSQNGFDNSGRACDLQDPPKQCFVPCPPEPLWGKDASGETVNETLGTLARIATRYAGNPAIWGIELLNEPRLINVSVLKDFYARGYAMVRTIVGNDWKVVIHDGFYPLGWADFMTPAQGYTGVVLDTHVYEAFGDNVNLDYENHLIEACGYSTNINFMECAELPLIVGEWSMASTDCTRWLNGFGQNASSTLCGDRHPNAPWNSTFMIDYGKRQLSAFVRGSGFFFWNFKTETAPEWSLFAMVELGFLPSSFATIDAEIINYCNYSSV